MSHIVIVGGGAALAQPLIRHYLDNEYGRDNRVTAICRKHLPDVNGIPSRRRDRLTVIEPVNMASDPDAHAVFSTLTSPIDLLVTMTGSSWNAKLEEMTTNQFDAMLDANLVTVFHALKYGLPKVRQGGSVVVVGSVVGRTGGFGCCNYAAAKAGLVGLVKAAANEYASKGVRVNLLELGFIDAGMGKLLPEYVREKMLKTIPMGRFGTEQEVVDAVDFLGRAYTTGGVLSLAGGL